MGNNTSKSHEKSAEKVLSKRLCAGILAHVDAGKTTLAEALLYQAGALRKLGRVDEKNSFLDTFALERRRGITIFSKEARIEEGDTQIILLDTPGHVDFAAEMERVLQVIDFGILVINGTDGVQAHTRTLWRLLELYQVPVFIFVNKMDLPGVDREQLQRQLNGELQEGCIDFQKEEDKLWEEAATCDEEALEEYLETGRLETETIRRLIGSRKLIPCYFGSALKLWQTEAFLKGIFTYGQTKDWSQTKKEKKEKVGEEKGTGGFRQKETEIPQKESFGAKIFKITRDDRGSRITHVRITGGRIGLRESIPYRDEEGTLYTEKIHQIRIYSGDRYTCQEEAMAGEICGITGLSHTRAGEGLGWEEGKGRPLLEPVLKYRVEAEETADIHEVLQAFQKLEEEDPMLKVEWCRKTQELYVRLMGEVQVEILQAWIQEKYGLRVRFAKGSILYKETIADTVVGSGHFEPLKHYAEVHLKLEPLPRGSGVEIERDCDTNMLEEHWQKLVVTALKEEGIKGVLTGAEVTDIRITLIAGRAHIRHTEGGDFREAARRALRQGLLKARSVLLEPYYSVWIQAPSENAGRLLTDLDRRGARLFPLEQAGETVLIRGEAPVSALEQYAREVAAFTGGRGSCSLTVEGYGTCQEPQQVIEMAGYSPEEDKEWPAGSIFCCQGSGISVSWKEAEERMHVHTDEGRQKPEEDTGTGVRTGRSVSGNREITQEEMEEILLRTYGRVGGKERRKQTVSAGNHATSREPVQEYLLVDGYNVIFAWKELKELAQEDISAARWRLLDVLSDYQGYRGIPVIAVFDAYKVEGNPTKVEKYHNVFVVYTKEAETADQYIEKTVHRMGRKHHVTVVTSDWVEQVIIQGQGGTLLSSREFLEEILRIKKEGLAYQKSRPTGKTYLFDGVGESLAGQVEEVRLGKKERID